MNGKVLVIGDSGLLGQALMERGILAGYEVRGASRHSSDIALDALDVDKVNDALDLFDPGVVVNAAGFVDVNGCERSPAMAWMQNARLPALLSFSCAARDIRFVHVSTDHYYSGDGASPHDESCPVICVNEYARTKYAGEFLALTSPKALVLRTNIVGFRGWKAAPTFVEWLINSLISGAPIDLYSDFYTSSMAATQFADALFHLLETRATGVLNVASSEGASKLDFSVALAGQLGLSTQNTRPGSVLSIPGVRRAESLVLCTRKAEVQLGVKLPSLHAVVEQLAREFHERKFREEARTCDTHR